MQQRKDQWYGSAPKPMQMNWTQRISHYCHVKKPSLRTSCSQLPKRCFLAAACATTLVPSYACSGHIVVVVPTAAASRISCVLPCNACARQRLGGLTLPSPCRGIERVKHPPHPIEVGPPSATKADPFTSVHRLGLATIPLQLGCVILST